MRIGLNLLPVVPGIGGAWRYIANLLDALSTYDTGNEYVAFVTSASASIVPQHKRFTSIQLPFNAGARHVRVAFENSVLPLISREEHLDCMHHVFGTLPLFGGEPTVVSIFDLMVFARPRDFSPVKRAYLRTMRRRAAGSATVLAPMSQATADALHEWLQVPRDRMITVPAAIRSEFTRSNIGELQAFRARHGLGDDFWLCVAGPYPHKNLDRLLEAFGALERSGSNWSLVIRGGRTNEVAKQVEASLQGRVRLLPWLEDREMPLLYSAARALIFPSLYEGGGLPVMEAMASGCPVVASNLPTTREFAGDAALTFDPMHVSDMVRAMSECERSPELRSQMAIAGRTLAARLSPENAAAACQRAYRAAIFGRDAKD